MEFSPVTVAVEGPSDEAIARAVLRHAGLDAGTVFVRRGKAGVDKGLAGFNRAARFAPWLVLRDLDRDAPCAAELVRRLLPAPSALTCFRVAVRSAEAWLLADRQRMGEFLSIPPKLVPAHPDGLDDPKAELVNLARKSRKRAIRDDMVPAQGAIVKVGPAYVSRIIEFASERWGPGTAAAPSESLRRSLSSMEHLKHAITDPPSIGDDDA
jgi:hypothetical protein